MPFPLRVIKERSDVNGVCDINNDPTNILQKTNVMNMIGLLNQLNQVSLFASEIFQDILKTTTKTSSRIKSCKQRINGLQQKLPSVEAMLLTNAPSYFYDNPFSGKEYLRNDPLNGLLFSREDANNVVNRQRNRANKPYHSTDPSYPSDPSKLDPLSTSLNKKPCIKYFTDTDFFINEWLENEKRKREEERKKRRQNRKNKPKKNKRKHKTKIVGINKPIYDEHGNKIQYKEERQIDVKQYELLDDHRNFDALMNKKEKKKDKKRSKAEEIPTASSPPPRPPASAHHHEKTNVSYANVANPNDRKAHVTVTSIGTSSPPPNPLRLTQSTSKTPPGNSNNAMVSYPPPNPLQLTTSKSKQDQLRDLAGIIPIENDAEVPDDVMSPSELYATQYQGRDLKNALALNAASSQIVQTKPAKSGGAQLSFLGDIQNFKSSGTKLKRTEQVKRQIPQDNRSNLLRQLRGGIQLSSVNLRKVPEKVEKKNLIFEAMKDRRRHLEESSSEEESDWGSDSD